ncbi:MAG TPA: MCP four helix bundle domain-containing protein [Thiobacillaceae bacterium]|nr:MCP four helix bundle domain-containing protein [Thiobacillaceae bacterium]HNH89402.1 MCP four helix bundle domain-containing protein [Thiobacillaceae bacterium]HNI07031.1 MCP four helix bundle domain-containing protein [Thiobacillaceae bacterium]
MRHSLLLSLFTLGGLMAGPCLAAPSDDACAALMEARGYLVTMIGSSDKAANDDLKAKIQAASARLDATLVAMTKSYNAGDEAKVASFRPVWEDFKKTRESEIIPLVYAGKNADAKAIATGIQAERMGKMKAAMGCK